MFVVAGSDWPLRMPSCVWEEWPAAREKRGMPGFRRRRACIRGCGPAVPGSPSRRAAVADASDHQHREEVQRASREHEEVPDEVHIAPAPRKEEDADGIGEAPSEKELHADRR